MLRERERGAGEHVVALHTGRQEGTRRVLARSQTVSQRSAAGDMKVQAAEEPQAKKQKLEEKDDLR